MYWGTCKAGPNSGHKRAGRAKNGGVSVTCRGASCPGGPSTSNGGPGGGGETEGDVNRRRRETPAPAKVRFFEAAKKAAYIT